MIRSSEGVPSPDTGDVPVLSVDTTVSLRPHVTVLPEFEALATTTDPPIA